MLQPSDVDAVTDREMRAIVDIARESILVTDANLERPGPRIVYVNSAFERLTGFTRKEAVGRTPRMLQGPKTDRAVLARLKAELSAGKDFEGEAVNYTKGGQEIILRWYVKPLHDEAGNTVRYVGVQRDVTEARRAQQSALRLEAAFESLQDVVLILGSNLAVRYVNPALSRLVGRPRNELLGRYVARLDFLHPAFGDGELGRVLKELDAESTWQGDLAVRRPGGQIINLSSTISKIRLVEGNFSYVLVGRDLTRERRVEAVASALNMTENTGYIFAGLRHELGNPVNSLKSAMTVVKQGLATFPPEKLANYVDRMLEEVSRMEYLLSALKSVNPSSSVSLRRLDVCDFLIRFIPLIERDLSQRQVAITLGLEIPELFIEADTRALHQVLLNLITNAADALRDRAEPQIRIAVESSGEEVVVTVIDNGAGMSEEQRERLFQPFHTTKTEGTGLGLVITQRLVAQMNGTLQIASEAGVGTRVAVSFVRA